MCRKKLLPCIITNSCWIMHKLYLSKWHATAETLESCAAWSLCWQSCCEICVIDLRHTPRPPKLRAVTPDWTAKEMHCCRTVNCGGYYRWKFRHKITWYIQYACQCPFFALDTAYSLWTSSTLGGISRSSAACICHNASCSAITLACIGHCSVCFVSVLHDKAAIVVTW